MLLFFVYYKWGEILKVKLKDFRMKKYLKSVLKYLEFKWFLKCWDLVSLGLCGDIMF